MSSALLVLVLAIVSPLLASAQSVKVKVVGNREGKVIFRTADGTSYTTSCSFTRFSKSEAVERSCRSLAIGRHLTASVSTNEKSLITAPYQSRSGEAITVYDILSVERDVSEK